MKQIYLDKAIQLVNDISKTKIKPGGLPWLLEQKENISSQQSLHIKVGKGFEPWFKFVVEDCGLELLPDGIIENVIGNKSKDIDFLFKNEKEKIIFYRELKSNLHLDTEKVVATCTKIKKVKEYLSKRHPGYEIDAALLHWGVYEPSILPYVYKSRMKTCKKEGVRVTYPIDFFKLISSNISEDDYYSMWRKINNLL